MSVPNLLTISDFDTYPIRIIEDDDFGNDNLDDIITTYQPYYLRELLGEAEYSKFENDYSGSGFTWTSTHWNEFVNGATYTALSDKGTSITITWSGIKHVLKYFMYFHFIRDGQYYLTQTGIVKPSNENALNYNISALSTNSWNQGTDIWGKDWNYLFTKEVGYKQGINDLKYYTRNFKPETYINTTIERVKNTAYNFIYYYTQRDSSVFPDWEFYSRKNLNINNI